MRGEIILNINFDLTKFFTLPNKILGAIALATGMMLFMPTNILDLLYISQITERYGSIIGIIFIISLSIVIVSLIFSLSSLIRKNYDDKRFPEKTFRYLKNMSEEEKALVFSMYIAEGYMKDLPIHEGTVIELENTGVIVRTATQVMVDGIHNTIYDPHFPFYLQKWVRKHMEEDNSLMKEFKQSYDSARFKQ